MRAIAKAGVLAALVALATSGCTGAVAGTGRARLSRAPAHTAPARRDPATQPSARAVAAPVRTPCTHNALARYVFVSIRRQHMWMCARHRVALDTAITSGSVGEYTSTPTGTFEIQGKVRDTWLTLIDGSSYQVKYWIPFQGPLFGFHDSSWQTFPYGSPKYRTEGSHGCVHMPLAAIRFLYRWADIGTTVRIKP